MELDPKAKDLELEDGGKEVEAKEEETALRQVQADTASAQTAEKEHPINWELLVLSRDALSVGPL